MSLRSLWRTALPILLVLLVANVTNAQTKRTNNPTKSLAKPYTNEPISLIPTPPKGSLTQGAANSPYPADTSKRVQILNAETLENTTRGGVQVRKLKGNVVLQQRNTTFSCDSAFIYPNSFIRSFGHIRIQQDSVDITGDSLRYFGDKRIAEIGGNCVLLNGKSRLTTKRVTYDLTRKLATYTTSGTITSRTSVLTSEYGQYNTRTRDAFFRTKVVVNDPNYHLEADSLRANTDTRIVTFISPTHITGKEGEKIYCEKGVYDTDKNNIVFEQNARYEKTDTKTNPPTTRKANADRMRYDGKTKTTYLEGRAHYIDNKQTLDADKIVYNETTGQYDTEGKTHINNGTQTVIADNARHDKATNATIFEGNVTIEDKTQTIAADRVTFNRTTHDGVAYGNAKKRAAVTDTKQGTTLSAETIFYNDSTGNLLARTRPELLTLLDKDSLWLAADTIRAFKTIAPKAVTSTKQPATENDTTRTMLAYPHVRMYKHDLQAVSDSLSYSTSDSTFRFFRKPLLWADTTQFSADTINIRLANKHIDYVHLYTNAFIVNTRDLRFYNQIKGKIILSQFAANKLQRMRVLGNAESLYYVLDEKNAYVGINKAESSSMTMFFADNKIQRVHFYENPTASFVPMKKADHAQLRIRGWEWWRNLRPRGRWDLRR